MNIHILCDKFLALINQSQGKLILLENGEKYAFQQHKTQTLAQIKTFERNHQLTLPDDYRYFLQMLGACELYFDERELGIEFYSLDKILDFMTQVLVTWENLQFLPSMIFIGSNLNNGGIIALNLTKPDSENLTIFYTDDDPEGWLEMDNDYTSLVNFLGKIYLSNGEDYYL